MDKKIKLTVSVSGTKFIEYIGGVKASVVTELSGDNLESLGVG